MPAALAFAQIWTELQPRLDLRGAPITSAAGTSMPLIQSIEALIAGFDSPEAGLSAGTKSAHSDMQFVHSFDTDRRDLQRCGCALELRERSDTFILAASRSGADRVEGRDDAAACVQAQIDARWAMQILSGALSPLVALERRLGQPTPPLVGHLRAAVGDGALRRVNSSATTSTSRVA